MSESQMEKTDDVAPESGVEPTADESATLEHVSDQIPSAVWLIIVCEFCERFAFFGLSGPFQNYIQFPVPAAGEKQPGALNRGQRMATLLTTFFRFLCYLTPIGGAILADQFWGKYKTILLACIVYALGLLVLVLSSLPPSIEAGVAFPGLIIAMIILGFGTGGVKSNVSPLMAEQYTRTKPIVTEIRNKRVIVDPKMSDGLLLRCPEGRHFSVVERCSRCSIGSIGRSISVHSRRSSLPMWRSIIPSGWPI